MARHKQKVNYEAWGPQKKSFAHCTCRFLSHAPFTPSLPHSLCSDSVIHGGIIFPLSVPPIIISLTSPSVSGEY
ncbi:hypothetical protein AMECASPLE_009809 [Ameca splendens]|uniref:Uncharacterized protein n=1 Tax=Ameca splendens TaxID=208324 RepID=A0ABV0ZX70_9TELE